ncbi:unnamed protein product [Allacma fusca]|uniref:Uncharacterized protein n=1 Tax=Allacma fusca TaxID=39272 RepID=A0A8J2PM31_9HEXA|nr:unnamed protein product [Allacma fusca]
MAPEEISDIVGHVQVNEFNATNNKITEDCFEQELENTKRSNFHVCRAHMMKTLLLELRAHYPNQSDVVHDVKYLLKKSYADIFGIIFCNAPVVARVAGSIDKSPIYKSTCFEIVFRDVASNITDDASKDKSTKPNAYLLQHSSFFSRDGPQLLSNLVGKFKFNHAKHWMMNVAKYDKFVMAEQGRMSGKHIVFDMWYSESEMVDNALIDILCVFEEVSTCPDHTVTTPLATGQYWQKTTAKIVADMNGEAKLRRCSHEGCANQLVSQRLQYQTQ